MLSPACQRPSSDLALFAAPDELEPRKRPATAAWLLLVLAVSLAYLYASLFSFAGTPHFRTGDEDFFWTYACRLLDGQQFLKDFHQFTPPGTDLVYAAVFHFFGSGVRSIDATILCLGLALALVCFLVARIVMRAGMAALAALLCLVVLYGDRMDATHHWFSSLANLLAILALLPARSSLRIAVAAGLVAVAAFCTQTAGAMGLLACCAGLWWEKRIGLVSARLFWSRLAMLAGATFGAWLLLSWRFIAGAGVAAWWRAQVAYLPRDANFPTGFLIPHFTASLHLRPLIAIADHLAVYLLLLLVCPWVASLCLRRQLHTRENSVALFLLASLGILQTLEIITMLNWNRMAAVAMPSVILCVWLIGRMGSPNRPLTIACWCIAGGLMLVQSAATQFRRYTPVHLPAGTALLDPEDREEVEWLARHTHPGDNFFEVANTRLYAPLALRNPTPVDLLTTLDVTLPSWVAESVQALTEHRVQYVLWSPHSGIGSVAQTHRAQSDRLDPLRACLLQNYMRIAVFANGDEIWAHEEISREATSAE